jgi:hypothetical protein
MVDMVKNQGVLDVGATPSGYRVVMVLRDGMRLSAFPSEDMISACGIQDRDMVFS